MIRRFMPYDLDDLQFQVIRETRGNRRHLIIVPPAKPGCSPREAAFMNRCAVKICGSRGITGLL